MLDSESVTFNSAARLAVAMAEVAGLVLGVVGLAGVIGAFKDVVDLFSLFVDSSHLGRDYEMITRYKAGHREDDADALG